MSAALRAELARRLAVVNMGANLVGALDVFAFLYFLAPLGVADAPDQRVANLVAIGIYLPVSLLLGHRAGTRVFAPVATWLEIGAPERGLEPELVLRQPLRQTGINAALWMLAALTFGLVNVAYSSVTVRPIVTTILLGGLTSCGIAYLWTERVLRPAVTLALAGASCPPTVVIGVAPRLLLAWGWAAASRWSGSSLASPSQRPDRSP